MHRVAGALLVGVLLAAGCTSPAQRAEMSRQALASDAVEGARLARLIVEDQAGRTFARTHAQELADDVQRVQEDMADHETRDGSNLIGLADQLGRALGSITIQPTNHAVAGAAEKTLTKLASRIAGTAS